MANLLWELGIRPGDRVATLMPRVPELYASLLGIWKTLRIGPFEVESALVAHEAVQEAGVVGKPDAAQG